jgi:hypothetical protein|tara:strand:+ start:506 stop:637 length:132 start_codon:yes stop_codon:yes gene_type:complete
MWFMAYRDNEPGSEPGSGKISAWYWLEISPSCPKEESKVPVAV